MNDLKDWRSSMNDRKKKIEYDINARWEKGIPHHPKSEKLFKRLEEIDFKYGEDYFCWKSGGDGDNGEHLLYVLDILFEEEVIMDKSQRKIVEAHIIIMQGQIDNGHLPKEAQIEVNAIKALHIENDALKSIRDSSMKDIKLLELFLHNTRKDLTQAKASLDTQALHYGGVIDHLNAEIERLLNGYPEGMTPTDVKILKKANGDMAQEIHELQAELSKVTQNEPDER